MASNNSAGMAVLPVTAEPQTVFRPSVKMNFIEVVESYADIAETTNKRIVFVKQDETNEGTASLYTHDGVTLSPITSGSSVDQTLLANVSKLEGKHNLRDFYAAMYNYNSGSSAQANPSGVVGVACWGDSVGTHVWGEFLNTMLQSYPIGTAMQPTTMAVPGSSVPVVTGTVVDSGSLPIDMNVLDGSGGAADFTYLPDGSHFKMSNGSTLTLDAGHSRGFATARVYFAKGPGFGSAKVQLLDQDNEDTVTFEQTVSLSDTQLTGTKVQFAIDSSKTYKIKITATGTVVYLRGGFFYNHGISWLTLARGGTSLAHNNFASVAITQYLMNEFNVKLMFVQAKEENAAVNVPAMFSRFTQLPGCSYLVVGSLPDSSDEASQLANNAIFREGALSNRCAYFDGYDACGNYNELVRLGWEGDGTHPADAANRFVANLIHAELNLMNALGTIERRNVDADKVNAVEFSVPAGDGSTNVVNYVVNYGGGDPFKVRMFNVATLELGAEGTAPKIAQRDPQTVQVLSTDDSPGRMYCGVIEQGVDGQQNYFAGTVLFNSWITPGQYTVATLPGVNEGAVAFATDGRKSGQGAGAGTGVLCYRSGGVWRVCGTDVQVQA